MADKGDQKRGGPPFAEKDQIPEWPADWAENVPLTPYQGGSPFPGLDDEQQGDRVVGPDKGEQEATDG